MKLTGGGFRGMRTRCSGKKAGVGSRRKTVSQLEGGRKYSFWRAGLWDQIGGVRWFTFTSY